VVRHTRGAKDGRQASMAVAGRRDRGPVAAREVASAEGGRGGGGDAAGRHSSGQPA